MDNKALLIELEKQIKLLESHIVRLKKNPEKLHDLDVEVIGDKLKEMYNLVCNLLPEEEPEVSLEFGVRSSVVEKVPLVEVKPEPEIPEPEIPEPKAPEMSAGPDEYRTPNTEHRTPNTEVEITNNEHPTPNTEHRPPSPEPQVSDPEPPAPDPEPIPAPRPPSPEPTDEPAKTTADLFSGPKTIADTFQAKEDNSIAATVIPQPSQDLKMAIGINDKFLFINELFQGDPSVYNQAIENMNTAGGLVHAISALDGYRAEYKWADNSEAYHRLKKIVNSKYNG